MFHTRALQARRLLLWKNHTGRIRAWKLRADDSYYSSTEENLRRADLNFLNQSLCAFWRYAWDAFKADWIIDFSHLYSPTSWPCLALALWNTLLSWQVHFAYDFQSINVSLPSAGAWKTCMAFDKFNIQMFSNLHRQLAWSLHWYNIHSCLNGSALKS